MKLPKAVFCSWLPNEAIFGRERILWLPSIIVIVLRERLQRFGSQDRGLTNGFALGTEGKAQSVSRARLDAVQWLVHRLGHSCCDIVSGMARCFETE